MQKSGQDSQGIHSVYLDVCIKLEAKGFPYPVPSLYIVTVGTPRFDYPRFDVCIV